MTTIQGDSRLYQFQNQYSQQKPQFQQLHPNQQQQQSSQFQRNTVQGGSADINAIMQRYSITPSPQRYTVGYENPIRQVDSRPLNDFPFQQQQQLMPVNNNLQVAYPDLLDNDETSLMSSFNVSHTQPQVVNPYINNNDDSEIQQPNQYHKFQNLNIDEMNNQANKNNANYDRVTFGQVNQFNNIPPIQQPLPQYQQQQTNQNTQLSTPNTYNYNNNQTPIANKNPHPLCALLPNQQQQNVQEVQKKKNDHNNILAQLNDDKGMIFDSDDDDEITEQEGQLMRVDQMYAEMSVLNEEVMKKLTIYKNQLEKQSNKQQVKQQVKQDAQQLSDYYQSIIQKFQDLSIQDVSMLSVSRVSNNRSNFLNGTSFLRGNTKKEKEINVMMNLVEQFLTKFNGDEDNNNNKQSAPQTQINTNSYPPKEQIQIQQTPIKSADSYQPQVQQPAIATTYQYSPSSSPQQPQTAYPSYSYQSTTSNTANTAATTPFTYKPYEPSTQLNNFSYQPIQSPQKPAVIPTATETYKPIEKYNYQPISQETIKQSDPSAQKPSDTFKNETYQNQTSYEPYKPLGTNTYTYQPLQQQQTIKVEPFKPSNDFNYQPVIQQQQKQTIKIEPYKPSNDFNYQPILQQQQQQTIKIEPYKPSNDFSYQPVLQQQQTIKIEPYKPSIDFSYQPVQQNTYKQSTLPVNEQKNSTQPSYNPTEKYSYNYKPTISYQPTQGVSNVIPSNNYSKPVEEYKFQQNAPRPSLPIEIGKIVEEHSQQNKKDNPFSPRESSQGVFFPPSNDQDEKIKQTSFQSNQTDGLSSNQSANSTLAANSSQRSTFPLYGNSGQKEQPSGNYTQNNYQQQLPSYTQLGQIPQQKSEIYCANCDKYFNDDDFVSHAKRCDIEQAQKQSSIIEDTLSNEQSVQIVNKLDEKINKISQNYKQSLSLNQLPQTKYILDDTIQDLVNTLKSSNALLVKQVIRKIQTHSKQFETQQSLPQNSLKIYLYLKRIGNLLREKESALDQIAMLHEINCLYKPNQVVPQQQMLPVIPQTPLKQYQQQPNFYSPRQSYQVPPKQPGSAPFYRNTVSHNQEIEKKSQFYDIATEVKNKLPANHFGGHFLISELYEEAKNLDPSQWKQFLQNKFKVQ